MPGKTRNQNRVMKQEEFDAIVSSHRKWLAGKPGGKRANLSGKYLRNICVGEVDLRGANLRETDLFGVNLRDAKLANANVSCVGGQLLLATQGVQGECGRQITLLADGKEAKWIIYCGCFQGRFVDLVRWLNKNDRAGWERESTMMCVKFLFDLARKASSNRDE